MTAPGMKIMMGLARNGNPYLTYTPYSPTLHTSSLPRRFLPTKSAQKRGSQHIIRTTAGVSLNKPAGQPASQSNQFSSTSSVNSVRSVPGETVLHHGVGQFASFYSHTPWPRCNHTSIHTGLPCRHQGFQQGHGQRQISPFRAASAVYLYSFANLCPTTPAAC